MLTSAVITGLGLGSMYGLLALGFHVTYAVSNTVNFIFALPALLIFAWSTGHLPNLSLAALPFVMAIQFLLTLGVAYFLAMLHVPFRDTQYVLGVLLFVYLTSAGFVERQTEATLDAEITGLAEQYAQRGLSGLIQIVAARSAGDRSDAMIYLVTDPDGKPLVGNIAAWPAGVPTHSAWLSFALERTINGRHEVHPARGRLFVIPGGYRLLVGRDISDEAAFRSEVRTTLLWAGLIALGLHCRG